MPIEEVEMFVSVDVLVSQHTFGLIFRMTKVTFWIFWLSIQWDLYNCICHI